MPDRSWGKTLADLYRDLPRTFSTPPHCSEEVKYGVVAIVAEEFTQDGIEFADQPPANLVTVNGVRVVAQAGTWRLVRASSNKAEIVVVVESPVSPERRREMFEAVDAVLRRNPEVGAYNQTF